MRAVQISRYGGPEVLESVDIDEPVPRAGQVVIAVSAIEVLFIDTQLRAGWGEDYFDMRPPWIPGTGVAGTVTDVGDSSVGVGRTVVARTGNLGAYAERVAVDTGEVFEVRDGLDPVVATAALHDGVLALDRLERAQLRGGMRVLVTAAAGSLGHWFVPLAKEAGAYVAAAAGGDRKTAVVAGLGADLALDYRRAGWAEQLGEPFDVVFDGTGGEVGSAALDHTADGGLFFAHGAASGDFASSSDLRGITVLGVESQIGDRDRVRFTELGLQLLADGAVTPAIGQRVPLERAADAHAAMADRSVIGKTILLV